MEFHKLVIEMIQCGLHVATQLTLMKLSKYTFMQIHYLDFLLHRVITHKSSVFSLIVETL